MAFSKAQRFKHEDRSESPFQQDRENYRFSKLNLQDKLQIDTQPLSNIGTYKLLKERKNTID